MSEGGRAPRAPRAPPKLSTGLKTATSASQDPKARASKGSRAQSARGAAQAKRSTSQSPTSSDESVQTVQEALSALQLIVPLRTRIHGLGNAAPGPSEPGASTALGPRTGQERSSRQGGTGASSRLHVPGMPRNEASGISLADLAAKERLASQLGRGSAPRAVEVAGPSSTRTLSQALGKGAAPRAVEAAGPSSSPTPREALGRGAASPSGVGFRQSTGAAPLATTRAATAVKSESEGSISERSSTVYTTSTSESEDSGQPSRRQGFSWDDETRAQVFRFLEGKMNEMEIRSRTGVSLSTIQHWKRRWARENEPFPSMHSRRRPSANRQGRRAYDAETRARVFTYVAAGMPQQQISDITGVSITTICNWKKAEALLPSKPSLGLAWSPEIRARVCRLLAQGMPAPEIKEITGVPITTMYRWRREDFEAVPVDL